MAEIKSGSGGTFYTGNTNRYFYSLLVYNTSSDNTSYTVSATSKVEISGNYGVTANWSGTLSATGKSSVTGSGSTSYKSTACSNRTEGRDIKTLCSTNFSWTKACSNQSVTVSSTVKCTGGSGLTGWYNKSVTASGSFTVPARTKYSITYNANGGTLASNTVSRCAQCGGNHKSYGYNAIISSAIPTRSGYTFLRWETSGGTPYNPGSTYSTNGDLSLQAVWQQNPSCSPGTPSASPYYTGANYSISIDQATAYNEAGIASIVLKVGNNTSNSLTNDGILNITLPSVTGLFTPVVTITDTLGASTSYNLTPINIQQYVLPDIQFTVERTLNTGAREETNGTACVITATFTFCEDAYKLREPIVTCNESSPTITWYTERNPITGVITTSSNISSWNNIEDEQTIYGLITYPVLSTSATYVIAITPEDTRDRGVTKKQILPMAVFPIDVYAGGTGVAFGRVATSDGLFCKMDATFEEGMSLLLDTNGSNSIDTNLKTAIQNKSLTNALNANGDIVNLKVLLTQIINNL